MISSFLLYWIILLRFRFPVCNPCFCCNVPSILSTLLLLLYQSRELALLLLERALCLASQLLSSREQLIIIEQSLYSSFSSRAEVAVATTQATTLSSRASSRELSSQLLLLLQLVVLALVVESSSSSRVVERQSTGSTYNYFRQLLDPRLETLEVRRINKNSGVVNHLRLLLLRITQVFLPQTRPNDEKQHSIFVFRCKQRV